jgi:hypothetical protein
VTRFKLSDDERDLVLAGLFKLRVARAEDEELGERIVALAGIGATSNDRRNSASGTVLVVSEPGPAWSVRASSAWAAPGTPL